MSARILFYCHLFVVSNGIKDTQSQLVNDIIDTPAFLTGDVVIGGLFHIFNTKQPDRCDLDLDMYSVMEMEAVKWSLMRLNEVNFIPGVRLGLLAYPTCGKPSIAALQSNKFLQFLREHRTSNKTNKPVFIKAIIGPTFSSESAVVSRILSSVPDDYKLLQVSYSSTAAFLTNKTNAEMYLNFFRTIPSDKIQTQTILDLLVDLGWTYIGLIHSGDAYGKDAARELSDALAERRICIAAVYQCDSVYDISRARFHEILYNITALRIKGIVFIGAVTMVRSFIDSVERIPFSQYSVPSIIFSESLGLQSEIFFNSESKEIYPAAKGSFVMSPPHKEMFEFSEYWNSMFANMSMNQNDTQINPWLQQLMKLQLGYNKLNVDNLLTKYPSSTFVKYAIMATYSVAKTIKDVHQKVCRGISGLCSEMKENRLSEYIEQARRTVVDFERDFPQKAKLRNLTERISFSREGDIQFQNSGLMYEVYNYQSPSNGTNFEFVNVGFLKEQETPAEGGKPKFTLLKPRVKFYDNMGRITNTVKSICQPNTTCTKCLPNHESETYLYDPGDVIVVVTFPIHNRGSEPIHCGPVRRRIGLDVALGAKFAINKINENSDIFPNKKVGLLLLDTCDDPLITSDIILELQLHGQINDRIPNISDKILGYAGGFSSSPTLQVADITTELKTVQVSCCATSDLLSDRLNYPYFLGLATPLNYTTRVMLQLVNKLGSNNIQVLFSDGKYGESAVKLILSLAPSFNICVAQTVRVYGGDNSISSLVTSLQRFPGARHVLVYIASPLMPKVARAINNMNEHRRFLFIGENCFYHRDYMLKYPNLRGSLIVAEQPIPQSDEYKTFLRNLDPACVELPKSLLYFMQENLNCYYEFSFRKEFPQKCHRELLRKFPEHLDKWTPYLIKSTTALIKGAYQAIKSMCKDETICSEYRNSPERVVEFVRNVTLDTDGDDRDDQLFDSNGNGVLGLKIYIIEEKDFVEIGHWHHGDAEPYFERKRIKVYPSNSSCGDVSKSVTHSESKAETSGIIKLLKTVLLSVFAGTIVILLLAFLCIWRRQTYIMSSKSSDTCTKSEYNSIDDFSIINMKRINSEISLRLGDFFRTDSPYGTPKSARSTGDITENSNQVRNERIITGVKNSPLVPPRRNTPGLPTHVSNHPPRHPRLRSEPVIKLSISPNTARRLNSEPLPKMHRGRADSIGMPYILAPKSRRLQSEPNLPSPNFNRLLFNNAIRRESVQDNGYIFPINEPRDQQQTEIMEIADSVQEAEEVDMSTEQTEIPVADRARQIEEADATQQGEEACGGPVLFVLGNPRDKMHGYSC